MTHGAAPGSDASARGGTPPPELADAAHQALQDWEARSRIVDDFARALAATRLERTVLLDVVVRRVSDALGGAAVLFVLSEDGTTLECEAVHHADPEAARMIDQIFRVAPHGVEDGLLGIVTASREPLFVPVVPDELLREAYPKDVHHEYFDRFGVHSLVVVPVMAHDQLLAVLAVAQDQPSESYTSDDLAVVQDLAARAGLVFDNANLLATARQQAAELQAILDTAVDAIISIDEHGTVRRANRAAAELFGYAPDDLLGGNVARLLPDALADRHDGFIQTYLETGTGSAVGERRQLEGRHRDGTRIPIEASVSEVVFDSGRRLFTAIVRDISAWKRTEEALEVLAGSDPLTGLANRRAFSEQLRRSIEAGRAGAVLFVDLDGFKQVNDRRGHAAGDRVLRAAAERVAGSLRAPDVAARFGGDEFTLLVHEAGGDPGSIDRVARRVSRLFSHPVSIGRDRFRFTVSIGIAPFPDGSIDHDELIRQADAAMYFAKRQGGATTATYQAGLDL